MYVPVLYRTVYRIVFEKVTKTKESMRIMGMSDFPYWLSWMLQYSVFNLVLVVCCWALLCVNIFKWESSYVLLIVMWVYGQSLFGLIIFTQSLFSTPRAAAITSTLVYFGTTIIYLLTDDPSASREVKFGLCWFFPTIAMCHTMVSFIRFSTSGINATFSTWTWQY